MWNDLLAISSELAGEYPKHIGVGEAAIDALLGFIVVFLGIAFLVGVIWLVGFIMRKTAGKAPAKKEVQTKTAADAANSSADKEDEVSEETVAVITAAIMAYYSEEKPKCEFTVKRIKRI